MIKFADNKTHINKLVEAMKTNDEAAVKEAWTSFEKGILEQMSAEMNEIMESNDSAILAQRGIRQLTSAETKWYQKVINALKSNDPKQAFTTIIGNGDIEDDFMPETIIESVFQDLEQEHELLSVINFQNVGYTTTWLLNNHSTQLAVWGKITDEITKEIESAFESIKLDQNKLSAFAMIELSMLELGPKFLDTYVRKCLAEAISEGLEEGILKGTGLNQPIGLCKNLSSYDPSKGYADKTKVTLKSFSPEEYGKVVAQMAKTEKGKTRKFKEVVLVVNQNEYLTKIMPATTMVTSNGAYARDMFPIATKVVISNELADNEAVMFLKDKYFFGLGVSRRNGIIDYSDEFKFLDDVRTFKTVLHGAGRPEDNTSAIFLDITNLEPAYLKVKEVTPTA